MADYVVLNLAMLAVILLTVVVTRTRLLTRPVIVTMLILLATTALFDNLIIKYGVVAYDVARIAGISVGVAPLEDFAYTIAAVLLVPLLWQKLKGKT